MREENKKENEVLCLIFSPLIYSHFNQRRSPAWCEGFRLSLTKKKKKVKKKVKKRVCFFFFPFQPNKRICEQNFSSDGFSYRDTKVGHNVIPIQSLLMLNEWTW